MERYFDNLKGGVSSEQQRGVRGACSVSKCYSHPIRPFSFYAGDIPCFKFSKSCVTDLMYHNSPPRSVRRVLCLPRASRVLVLPPRLVKPCRWGAWSWLCCSGCWWRYWVSVQNMACSFWVLETCGSCFDTPSVCSDFMKKIL